MRWLGKINFRGLLSGAVVVAALSVTAGCTSSAQLPANRAAQAFQTALHSNNNEAACDLLSEESRSALELTSTHPCAVALKALNLASDPPRSVEVWGNNAQVRLPQGVLFLAEFPSGWKITGAGCQAQPENRYTCAVRS